MNYQTLLEELLLQKDEAQALQCQRFFKTAPGEYAHGDKFYGIKVPILRKIVKKYVLLSIEDLTKMLDSPMHEERFIALQIIKIRYEKSNYQEEKDFWFDFTLKHINAINNWDLVDTFVEHVFGAHTFYCDKKLLYDLAHSSNLWYRRIAILSTFYFIRKGYFADTLAISQILLHDYHDLIQKAVGWMLREIGKRNEVMLLTFLEDHYTNMPRTMLRYSIEKLTHRERDYYMQKVD